MSRVSRRQATSRLGQKLWSEESGEDVVEHGLILSLVSLAVVGGATQLGLSIEAMWENLHRILVSILGSGP